MNSSTESKNLYEKEKELISRVLAGESDIFYRLIEPYSLKLLRKAQSILGNPVDAEDILQEALFTAYLALDKFRGESSIYTWLYRIVVNKSRDFLRLKKIKPVTLLKKHL